jgi:XapX domain-containing protein
MMGEILLALSVGLLIGAIFKILKLPVPVPHGLGGLIGLIGMYAGGELAARILQMMARG